MDFKEALQSIGTTSSDTEGVEKRFGIARRKVPAGFIQTDYAVDQYTDDKEDKPKKKSKKKKSKEKRKDEGRSITRNDRPKYSGDWHRDFFRKGDELDIEDEETEEDEEAKKDEEKLKELLMQVSGGHDQMFMDKYWDKGKKYDKNGNEIESEYDDYEKDDDKNKEDDDEDVKEARGITNIIDPHYDKKAIDPFWRKGKDTTVPNDEEQEEEEEEEEQEDD